MSVQNVCIWFWRHAAVFSSMQPSFLPTDIISTDSISLPVVPSYCKCVNALISVHSIVNTGLFPALSFCDETKRPPVLCAIGRRLNENDHAPHRPILTAAAVKTTADRAGLAGIDFRWIILKSFLLIRFFPVNDRWTSESTIVSSRDSSIETQWLT